jgi:peroxiredoxin
MRRAVLLGALLAASSPARAEPPHDFELYDLADRLYSLQRARRASKLVVVDFFSESCKPCRQALPAWRKLHARHAARGLALVIVAVPDDDDRSAARAAIDRVFRESPVPFPVTWDKYGRVAKQYRVARRGKLVLPQAFLLAASGALLRKSASVEAIAAEVARRLGQASE